MAKEMERIPDELKILLPEENKEIVLVGTKAYEMTPLIQKETEKISKNISDILAEIGNADRKCPKCLKVYRNAARRRRSVQQGDRMITEDNPLDDCPKCQVLLEDMAKPWMEAILSSNRINEMIKQLTGAPDEEIEKMTLPQKKHFAGVIWKQNFSDDGLPQDSPENFQGLLGMFGLGRPPAAKGPREEKAVESA